MTVDVGTTITIVLHSTSWSPATTSTAAIVGPVTGQYASFGAQMSNGGQMAVDDINAAGGVLGKTLDLDIGHDACDPKQAVPAAHQMTANGVAMCAGHYRRRSPIPAHDIPPTPALA